MATELKIKPNYTPLEITMLRKRVNRNELREKLNISGATLAKIAKGEPISLTTIAQICEYLDVGIEEVLYFENIDTLKRVGNYKYVV